MPRHETQIRDRELLANEIPLSFKRSIEDSQDTSHFLAIA
jgi:hypothetical protein